MIIIIKECGQTCNRLFQYEIKEQNLKVCLG